MADDPLPFLSKAYKKPEKGKKRTDGDDIVADAKKAFAAVQESESENRKEALDDIKFALMEEQWPEQIVKQRRDEGRPCHTINHLAAMIRQVVNDARQNKPSIKVHPVDSDADPETADVINGLIRNIEATSDADVAYDTATEDAASMGWGYFKVDLEYAHDDTFDQDLKIKRVSNPFSIYGDPDSTAADSSDWMTAFEIESVTREAFEAQFDGADPVDFNAEDPKGSERKLCEYGGSLTLANWWTREEVEKPIYLLSDGRVLNDEMLDQPIADEEMALVTQMMAMNGMTAPPQMTQRDLMSVVGLEIKAERTAKTWKVRKRILSGADVLADDDWAGIYIPIIPVYATEIDVEGVRHFRSMIHGAKDAQRDLNYWRTTATELVALAPRVPFIGPKGAFKTDASKWATANRVNHAYLEYDGQIPPQRQPLDIGGANGAMQQALAASDDIKAIVGLYDASLGQRSNETSGRAILARQKEGDVGQFHIQDNMARAIRHAGRILIDLIPKVYNTERVVRLLGEDGTPDHKPLGQPVPVTDPKTGQPVTDPQTGQPITRIYDLTVGKYDLVVKAGPSYTTRREESAAQMMQMVQAFPPAAPIVGDLIAKNLDWPGADEFAERIKAMQPPQLSGGLPPEVQQQMDQGKELIGQLQTENATLKTANEQAKLQALQTKVESAKKEVEGMIASAQTAQAPIDPVAEKQRLHEQELMHTANKNTMELQHTKAKQDIDLRGIQQKKMIELESQRQRNMDAAAHVASQQAMMPMGEPTEEEGEPEASAIDMLVQQAATQTQAVMQGMQLIAQEMQAVADTLAAPKRIIKDETGRPIGVETVTIQ